MPRRLVVERQGDDIYEYYPLGQYVVQAKGVCDGRPTFKYTRIEIAGTLERIDAGENIDAIVEGYRGRVSREAIVEAIQIAKEFGNKIKRTLPKRSGYELRA